MLGRFSALAALAITALALAGCGGEAGSSPAGGIPDNPFHPVAGTFEPNDTKLDGCEGGDNACLEQAFGNVSFKTGPKAAIALFDRKMLSDKAVEADCHRIAHTIGSAALARYRGNVARAFSEGSASCWSGYYHGILERAFYGVSSKSEMGKIARDVCDDEGIRKTTWLAYQCVHGLGHGLMIQGGYNLPLSLEICDQLATDWDRTSCHGGTFMENISSSYGTKSKWLKDDDLVYPCNAVEEKHKLYCYLMVTSRILQANGYNWEKTAKTCEGVEADWRATCFQSFGRDASGFSRQSPTEVVRLCDIAGSVGESDCIYGAARDMTANYAGGGVAAKMCRIAPQENKTRCFSGIGTILGTLHATSEGRIAACREVSGPFLAACAEGAGA